MTYEKFKNIVSQLDGKIKSVSGKSYSHIRVFRSNDIDWVSYQRESLSAEKINLQKLYRFYCGGVFKTTEAPKYDLKRVQSPSVAIAIAVRNKVTGLNLSNKNRLEQNDELMMEKYLSPIQSIETTPEAKISANDSKELIHPITFDEKLLMDEERFAKVSELTEDVFSDEPGLYAIRINDICVLPEDFSNALKQRKHNILYVGISKDSLKQRLWCEELHSKGHATFFRSMGAVLGYRPPKNSLSLTSRNYKFSKEDQKKIIQWIEKYLLVNYVICDYGKKTLESIEKELIKKYKPIINIKDNPYKLKALEDLRELCIRIARSE